MMRGLKWWLPMMLAATCLSCAPVGPPSTPPEKEDDTNIPVFSTNLKDNIERALDHVHARELRSTHSFWTVFHGILGNGLDVKMTDKKGTRVSVIDFICSGGKGDDELQGMIFKPAYKGKRFCGVRVARVGPENLSLQFYGQGHRDQFVAEVAQLGMPFDKKFIIDGQEFVFKDLVDYTMNSATTDRSKDETGSLELSWSMVAIAKYYGTKKTWTNIFDEEMKFEDLVQYEVKEPVIDQAPCGGTHRLFGLTYAYYLHRQAGGKKTGVWEKVADRIEKFKKLAKKYQNLDGTFSTSYFRSKAQDQRADTRISTTGHILEWLSLACTDEELRQPWIEDAARALSRLILSNSDKSIDSGALYHAAHGLHIYYSRVFDPERYHSPELPPPPKD